MKNNRIFILNNPYAPRLNAELAQEIGLNESIILLQLEYFISISKHEIDGAMWTYQSSGSLHEMFPFFSISTINRALKNLLNLGLLYEANYNKKKFDRTRWFSLNYHSLSKLKSININGYEDIAPIIEAENDAEILVGQNELSTGQNEPHKNQNEPRGNQNDLRQNQNEPCQNQNEPTIPKNTTKNKDIKDSQTSTSDPKTQVKIFEDDVYKITDKIIDNILINHPKAVLPEKEDRTSAFYIKWASEIDRLHRIGPPKGKIGYSYKEIGNIAKWALNDAFWLINIQSTSKLREKIVMLEAQYKASLNKSTSVTNKATQSKSNNKFHNFETRKTGYTNDQLEKMLGVKN